MIPITILTGFLGSGKTTLLKRIIEENPDKKFGLIINEFGEIGIDGQLVKDSGQEMIEMSNGCMCCVVRSDLYDTVEKLIDTGKVDYILIEASGLAEPRPIADTFVMNNLNGRVSLDGIVCLVDVENYRLDEGNYKIAMEQLEFCDIILLNKIGDHSVEKLHIVKDSLKKINPLAFVLENRGDYFSTGLLIETGRWTPEKLAEYKPEEEHDHGHEHHEGSHEHNHDHHDEHHKHDHGPRHRHHEHEDFDEVVFTTETGKNMDPVKLDKWLQNSFPANCIRAKGLLNMKTSQGQGCFLFQMVGASKSLQPFESSSPEGQPNFSRMVLIGKGLDRESILTDLRACIA